MKANWVFKTAETYNATEITARKIAEIYCKLTELQSDLCVYFVVKCETFHTAVLRCRGRDGCYLLAILYSNSVYLITLHCTVRYIMMSSVVENFDQLSSAEPRGGGGAEGPDPLSGSDWSWDSCKNQWHNFLSRVLGWGGWLPECCHMVWNMFQILRFESKHYSDPLWS